MDFGPGHRPCPLRLRGGADTVMEATERTVTLWCLNKRCWCEAGNLASPQQAFVREDLLVVLGPRYKPKLVCVVPCARVVW